MAALESKLAAFDPSNSNTGEDSSALSVIPDCCGNDEGDIDEGLPACLDESLR